MIKHNLKPIQEWNFDDDNIKKVYYNGSVVYLKVWSGDTPTPPTGDKFTIRYDSRSGETFYTVSCNSDSTITIEERTQSPYLYIYATDLVIGDCATKVGDSSFNRLPISSVTFSNSITEIGKYAFESCPKITSVELPQSLVTIGFQAFAYCPLTSVRIPDSVTSIGGQSFYQNTNLTNVVIGSRVKSIYSSAFGLCTGLTSINIPDSVTDIDVYCFEKCSGLTSVNIGSGITVIGHNAFDNCSKLSQVTINATTPPIIGQYVFNYTSNNLVIYVPSESVELYKTATNWSRFASRIKPIT